MVYSPLSPLPSFPAAVPLTRGERARVRACMPCAARTCCLLALVAVESAVEINRSRLSPGVEPYFRLSRGVEQPAEYVG